MYLWVSSSMDVPDTSTLRQNLKKLFPSFKSFWTTFLKVKQSKRALAVDWVFYNLRFWLVFWSLLIFFSIFIHNFLYIKFVCLSSWLGFIQVSFSFMDCRNTQVLNKNNCLCILAKKDVKRISWARKSTGYCCKTTLKYTPQRPWEWGRQWRQLRPAFLQEQLEHDPVSWQRQHFKGNVRNDPRTLLG